MAIGPKECAQKFADSLSKEPSFSKINDGATITVSVVKSPYHFDMLPRGPVTNISSVICRGYTYTKDVHYRLALNQVQWLTSVRPAVGDSYSCTYSWAYLFKTVKETEGNAYQYDAARVGNEEPIPHTLNNFIWHIAKPADSAGGFAMPILRPVGKLWLFEMFVELCNPFTGYGQTFDVGFYVGKSAGTTRIANISCLPNRRIYRTTAISDHEMSRDDFIAIRITTNCDPVPTELIAYARFYQYPYVLEDPQDNPPVP